jgi:hypothetical protein
MKNLYGTLRTGYAGFIDVRYLIEQRVHESNCAKFKAVESINMSDMSIEHREREFDLISHNTECTCTPRVVYKCAE